MHFAGHELALKDEGARNPDAVKALLDLDEITVDGDDVKGLEGQLETIKEEEDYLFEKKDKTPDKSGADFEGGTTTVESNPWTKDNLNLERQAEIKRNNPELAKQLISEAGKDPSKYDF